MSTLISTNPSRGYEIVGEVEISTLAEVKAAVARARQAQSAWAALSLKDRCTALASFIKIAEARQEDIAQIIAQETGRPIVSDRGLVRSGLEYLRAYIEMAEACLAPKITYETNREIHRVYREPWGVVACISPWNYPFLNVAFQFGQALIAGNTVVYKNSEENPLYSQLLADLFAQSAVPDGVFNVVYGDGQVGQWLAEADVDMISFTGSTQTGRRLTKIAAEKFIPILTELGGSSPCLVFADVQLTNEVVELIYNQRFVNAGQSCDAVKRLLVHETKFEELVDKLCEVVTSKKIGEALDETADISSLVAKRQLEKLEAQLGDAREKGAVVRIGGERPKGLQGAYYMPTILTGITNDMRVWQEETFGPVLPIVPFKTETEAIELANDTIYGLSAFVFTNNKQRYARVAHQLQAGMIAHNSALFWNPRNPFGGYKQSGMGRTHGQEGFNEITQVKLVTEEK